MKILAQIILALMIFFCGCHKKQVVHQSPPFDPLKEFLRTHGEHIQLLAIKYQIPKGKAEKDSVGVLWAPRLGLQLFTT